MAFRYAIALTGGIATGKSSACSIFKLFGFSIIDADKIAHNLLEENQENLKKIFSNSVIKDGKVDRKFIASIIFSNQQKKKELENLLHPQIFETIKEQSIHYDSFKKPYLVDIPLFFETKRYPIKDSICIYTPKKLQIERFIKRDNISQNEAIKRIESQLDIEIKKDLATYVVDNSLDIVHLQQECENLSKIIKDIR